MATAGVVTVVTVVRVVGVVVLRRGGYSSSFVFASVVESTILLQDVVVPVPVPIPSASPALPEELKSPPPTARLLHVLRLLLLPTVTVSFASVDEEEDAIVWGALRGIFTHRL